MELKDSISKVKGIGPKKTELLGKLKITTVEDLLYFFPRRYEDRTKVWTIMEAPFDQDVLKSTTPVCFFSVVVSFT